MIAKFIGKDEIDKAKALITQDLINKHSEQLEPSNNMLSFLTQAKNHHNTQKILNHFADKMTIKDELGVYSGEGLARFRYLNYIIPTIENPLIIIRRAKRNIYLKSFLDKKNHIHRFVVITENTQNGEVFITAFKTENNKNIKRLMNNADEVEFVGMLPQIPLNSLHGIGE
ncbi:hypothetical protein CQA49_09750 [Helicobacter sp. MIT 00-7814]|uniref:PBECR2 nuclease fold domain-containing protein n=1 Tax=unclassified Helicobacter TaxID=2593540 RepID=UPI000E1ED5C1|nr:MULTISPECIES: PBECR2 nuclease fold domain-containing protein [unclassified Helicobacter]RDU51303.1 hypothetical protein CQA49_09750 [Helicobacter sp. MIT 00-7814]RDU51469.1 hypothetical protein CQA37_09690 [Helicobacter sp. MIT 99-10781]